MKKVYHFFDLLIKLGAYVAGSLIMLTTLMVFYEVVSRSFFHKPTSWATELSIYAVIGSCFLGSAYAVRTYSHITVDLLINAVNDRVKTILAYLTNSLGLLFSIILTVYSYLHVMKTFALGVTSSSLLRIPMYIPESFLPIGGGLLCIAFIMQLIDGGIHEGGEHI
ncbi:TRAP transporter small permease [Sporosarcina pasteurii]|uniref:TRAP-type C4-dicarboxylate transport system, small permease component n=1 Tax=Sporosarcina pasteurii TaxID=1474 RepID=A0A380BE32_SPOPA|nr:TRAP transporter small permease [Sporosarcina pasteurii]MDS9472552.1 TRAP transporter small permease [Sporosarcina pasteurii]QBQ06105.1 TRAP transporter small permease [Sporosarcina pasteurii]SUI99424.1 TRAP-type C4-dicarboxylate transport system, small permease component [Sporosarcina pasteurii]